MYTWDNIGKLAYEKKSIIKSKVTVHTFLKSSYAHLVQKPGTKYWLYIAE
jgi:hypothetical protein